MVVFVKPVADTSGWHGNTAQYSGAQSLAPLAYHEALGGQRLEALPRTRRATLLTRVVAREILPRLALAKQAVARRDGAIRAAITTTEVDTEELVALLLGPEPADALAFIDSLRLRGITPEALYTGILSDAARCLGRLWDDDRCDFVRVSLGLGQLQQAARALAPAFQSGAVTLPNTHAVLLLPAPGEHHTFGLLLLAEFFRRAGWRVAGGPMPAEADPAGTVRNTWFDVAGFSLGSEERSKGLAATIQKIRRASCNRSLIVMVGGPLFLERPELAARVGADGTAADAPGAVRLATGLLTMRAAAE